MEYLLCCIGGRGSSGHPVLHSLALLLLLPQTVRDGHECSLISCSLIGCLLFRRRKALTKRRVRYAILDHKDNEESLQMLPRDGFQQTSLMVSESETEEEILFESPKKKTSNGGPKVANGKLKSPTNSV